MSDRTYAIFMTLIGAICGHVVIRRFADPGALTLSNALIQGFFVGFGLAVVTIEILARLKTTRPAWLGAPITGRIPIGCSPKRGRLSAEEREDRALQP